MSSASAPIGETGAKAPPSAGAQPGEQTEQFILTPEERRLVCRSLASSHHALAAMPPRLQPAGEIAGVNRLLRRLLGERWHQLVGTIRFRLK